MKYGKIIDQILIGIAIAMMSKGLSIAADISASVIRLEVKMVEFGRRIDEHEEKIKICENLKGDLWRLESKRSKRL